MCKKLTIPIFVLVVGWAITPAQAHCKGTAEHQFTHKNCGGGVRGGGGDDRYSAKVHFADLNCGTTESVRDHFCSDNVVYSGRGDYFDNLENVAAGGGKGPFELNLRHGSFRRFFLDFSDNCVEDTCGEVPVLTDGLPGLPVPVPATGLTGPSNQEGGNGYGYSWVDESGFSLLDMGVGEMKPRLVSISFNDFNNNAWKLSFDPDVCVSDPVSVTRTTLTSWDFESADGIACLERAKNGAKGPKILQGRYRVSFKFTVELWP